jgi:hypothetical protein
VGNTRLAIAQGWAHLVKEAHYQRETLQMMFALFALAIAAAFFASSLILLNYGRHLGLRYLQQKDAANMAGLTKLPFRIYRRDRNPNKQGLFWWTHKGSNLGPLPCEGNVCTKVFSQLVADLVRVRKFSAGKRTKPISRAPLLC